MASWEGCCEADIGQKNRCTHFLARMGLLFLLPGSAALDAGVDVGVTTDFDGDPRPMGDGHDIGADERFPVTIYLPLTLKNHSA